MSNYWYAALLILILIGSQACNAMACSSRAGLMNVEYQYAPFGGCMVKTQRGWLPIENYRYSDLPAP